jgi:hypothetical protein
MEWHEVVGHLRASYQVAHVTDQRIELWWRYPDDKIPIWQPQLLWQTEVNGEPYFVIAAEVSMPRRTRAMVSLQVRAGIGQLVEDGDSFQLRLTLPARGLAPPTLDHVLHAIAQEAAQLSALPRRWPSGSWAGAGVS